MKASIPICSPIASISAVVTSGWPKAMFSAIVPSTNHGSCRTMATVARVVFSAKEATSLPSIVIDPRSGRYSPRINASSADWSLPFEPTTQLLLPGAATMYAPSSSRTPSSSVKVRFRTSSPQLCGSTDRCRARNARRALCRSFFIYVCPLGFRSYRVEGRRQAHNGCEHSENHRRGKALSRPGAAGLPSNW